MGTPEFAAHTLEYLYEKGHNIIGVVTAPDRPAGRGQRLTPSAVKRFAAEKNLPVFQPVRLKAESFVEEMKALNPDVAVVVAFRMLPKVIWSIPKRGTFNLHASLLPDYRGAAPINHAIINGEKTSGVTTFFIDEQIDTGEIIMKAPVAIEDEDTAGSLHDKLMYKGAELVDETLELIASGPVKTQSQPKVAQPKMAPKLNNDNTRINWSDTPENIHNFIRGLNPYPGAWTIMQNGNDELRCKIFATEVQNESHNLPVGHVLKNGSSLRVALASGSITVTEIQLPGKRRMKTSDLLNGFHLKENVKML